MSQPAVGEKTEQWVRPAELGERGKRRAGQGEKGEDSRHERYHSESGTAHHLPPPPLMVQYSMTCMYSGNILNKGHLCIYRDSGSHDNLPVPVVCDM